jgi:twitching motility protein PilT
MSFKDLVLKAFKLGASDLHLESGTVIVARIRGELSPIGETLPGAQLMEMARELLNDEDWADFNVRGSVDLSVVVAGARCRINFYRTIRGLGLAARLLTPSVGNLRACNLHPDLRRLTAASTGLVLVSGSTGSGKSTTLAALLEEVNSSRALNIITLESPLEYVFANRRSFIRQREIPTHSPSFEQAITDALRENPDVLVIGEMRTPEVMRLTLDAAETGHLVLATMHSATCGEALSRLCMSFPSDIQGSIRAQLADCLVGVVCQRLQYLDRWQLRVPQCEILLPNSGARGLIRSGQFSQITNAIQSGGEDGMWTFERYQRWIDQQKEWARPATPPPVTGEGGIIRAATRVATPAGRVAPAGGSRVQPGRNSSYSRSSLPGRPAPAARSTPDPGYPEEINIDEPLDLEEIAALARKIEKGTP